MKIFHFDKFQFLTWLASRDSDVNKSAHNSAKHHYDHAPKRDAHDAIELKGGMEEN